MLVLVVLVVAMMNVSRGVGETGRSREITMENKLISWIFTMHR